MLTSIEVPKPTSSKEGPDAQSPWQGDPWGFMLTLSG